MKSDRKIWFTDSFVTKYGGIAKVIQSSVNYALEHDHHPRLSIIHSEEEFKAAKAKAVKRKRPQTVLGLAPKAEAKAGDL